MTYDDMNKMEHNTILQQCFSNWVPQKPCVSQENIRSRLLASRDCPYKIFK
jgi:hypothetical protein